MKNLIIFIFISLQFSLNAQNTLTGSFLYNGISRDYRLYVPASYFATSSHVPLVLNLHGYTSNNVEQEFYGSFTNIADTANFLILLPNGTIGPNGSRFWNTFVPHGTGVDDVGYINALLDTISAQYHVDQNRIYSTGMSNGGFMSYDLACYLSTRITAIASVTGSLSQNRINNCNPSHPMPVLEIHGTADQTVPYLGGTALNFVPTPDVVAFWKNFNHCDEPVISNVPNTNTADGCTAIHEVYANGDLGVSVEHYKIVGGEHTWPGSFFQIGVTNGDINASEQIWRFFRQYRLSDFPTAVPEIVNKEEKSIQVFPNPTSDKVEIIFGEFYEERKLQLMDALGHLVLDLPDASNKNIILELKDLKTGVYMLMVKEKNKVKMLKIVKQ